MRKADLLRNLSVVLPKKSDEEPVVKPKPIDRKVSDMSEPLPGYVGGDEQWLAGDDDETEGKD